MGGLIEELCAICGGQREVMLEVGDLLGEGEVVQDLGVVELFLKLSPPHGVGHNENAVGDCFLWGNQALDRGGAPRGTTEQLQSICMELE